jgi:hypothetical protein
VTSSFDLEPANVPPPAYCEPYTFLPPTPVTPDMMSTLLTAARKPLARCLHTGLQVKTSLNAMSWAARLVATRYPNAAAAHTLVTCIRQGVSLGYTGSRSGTRFGNNLVSAMPNEAAIDKDMAKQLSLGRRVGPLACHPFPFFRSNPLGVVFKRGSTKPRIIHHLSWPRNGPNVNAGLDDFDVKLDAFDQAVQSLRACGPDTFMAKIDIEAAYRCIPVRPPDWPLQGLQWKGHTYFDIVMQFGLSSATAIFEWYSSAAEFIAKRSFAIRYLHHYVDDFLILARSEAECKRYMEQIVALFAELGLPVAMDKLEGPLRVMLFLGIIFDSQTMMLRLSEERLRELVELLRSWQGRTQASRNELQSLCGILNFACKVVRSGRSFLRRMIMQLQAIPSWANCDTPYPLNAEFHKDVRWWVRFVEAWNGKAVVPTEPNPANQLVVYTDACDTGYGALYDTHWFAGSWTSEEKQMAMRQDRESMPWKEMYAIVRAAATWGTGWRGRNVLIRCDCQPVVLAWQRGDSKSPGLASLIRTLLFIAASHDIHFSMLHIAGVDNVFADLLSRDQVATFLARSRTHSRLPTIPSPLPSHDW